MRILFALWLFPTIVWGQLSQIAMTEKEIWDFLGGNTIGSDDFGPEDDSLEYHGLDGRALWYFEEEVQIGFYRIKGSQVCYTYEGEDLGTWFCWDFTRDRRTGQVYQWFDGTGYRMHILGAGNLLPP